MASSTKHVPSPNRPQVYLITGGTGAGKSTYARRLADEIGGLRFSIDDWMTTLFWMDSPEPIEHKWAMDRIARCESQIWDIALQALARGASIILDLGFTKAPHRAAFADRAKVAGFQAALHWVDVPADTRWERVQGRNAEKGETFAMEVPRGMFDFMEGEWEEPSSAEMTALAGVKVG